MGFVSLYFLAFLVATFLAYFLSPKKYRYIVLLVFSLVFYILYSWKSLFFLSFTTIVIYFLSNAISDNKNKEKAKLAELVDIDAEEKKTIKRHGKKQRKKYLIVGIVSIVIILILMKYLNFIIDNLNLIIGIFDSTAKIDAIKWLLPLGISFYTFQAIAYITDVYWGKFEAEKNFWKFALFMVFFPKILQGPIVRYNEMESLFEGHDFEYKNFTDGLKRMLWGYFKKMTIADCFVVFTNYAFANPSALYGAETFFVIICYFAYDYCDFSGYMDISCGISKCFGITLPENFNHPYFAISIDDYWRRWHKTLGAWFKDYVFYPLSISKFSLALGKKSKAVFKKNSNKIPAIFGLIVVWFLTGLWHGASWNYIAWGLYFGIIIILNIIFEPLYNSFYKRYNINTNSLFLKIFRHIRVLFLLAFGKVIFETSSLSATLTLFGNLFKGFRYFNVSNINSCIGMPSLIVGLCCSILVLVVDIIQEKHPETTFISKTEKLPTIVQWLILIIIIVAIVWFGYYGSGLPTSEFGYMRF